MMASLRTAMRDRIRQMNRGTIPRITILVPLLVLSVACSLDKLTKGAALPEQVVDPAQTETPAGALAAYRGTLVFLRDAMATGAAGYIPRSGQLSDELRYNIGAALWINPQASPDHRQWEDTYETSVADPYSGLQRVRGQASQAEGLLRDFPPENNQPLIAHMMAVRGYAELLLAELYCSGIPLSTLDYKGNFTYQPGLTTDEVFAHAVAVFDSALAIVGTDSLRILDLVRVGKGRALLQMGKFEEAAQAVVDVAPEFRYGLQYSFARQVIGLFGDINSSTSVFGGGFVGDREGVNGLAYLSERDARLPAMVSHTRSFSLQSPRTGMIPVTKDPDTITFSSGVEAQLIRAEAALRRNDPSWLTILNQLRTTCTNPATCATPAPRGTGGVDSLPPLTVPTDTPMTAKVNILFRERAFWLFLTGHRVGDMRRLMRLYDRDSETVFPTGAYDTNVPSYGEDVNLVVPRKEQDSNPYYRGCFDQGV